VSSDGRVRREIGGVSTSAGRLLNTTTPRCSGYAAVNLCGGKGTRPKLRLVHRLVAAAYIGECKPGFEVNHINAVRTDNRLENLEYVTRAGNMQHCIKLGRLRPGYVFGEIHGNAKLTDAIVMEIRSSDLTSAALSRHYGVSRTAIESARNRKTWRHVK